MAGKAAKPKGISYDDLRKKIKSGDMGGAFIFIGEETYLRDRALEDIRTLLIPKGAESFNVHIIDSAGGMEAVAQAVNSLPMLCEHILVIVKDFDLYKLPEQAQTRLSELLEDVPPYCTLIFVYDTIPYKTDARRKISGVLKKCAVTVDFALNDASRLTPWVRKHFESTGKTISPQNVQYLLFRVGLQMSALLGEIGKLAAYAKGSEITKEDIDAVVIPSLEAEAFELAQVICQGKRAEAFDLLDRLFSLRQEPIAVLGAVSWQMRRLYAASLVAAQRGGADKLAGLIPGMQPYSAKMTMQLAGRVTVPWCRRAVKLCSEVDFALKNTGGEPQALMEELVLQLSRGIKR